MRLCDGSMSQVLEEPANLFAVLTSRRGFGVGVDFLCRSRADNIVTNPPSIALKVFFASGVKLAKRKLGFC